MNILLRPIGLQDVDIFLHMTKEAPLGFDTMPKSKHLVEHRINRSLASFAKPAETPDKELYLFVAVDADSDEVLGISGIESTSGGSEPLVFYRKEMLQIDSPIKHVVKEIPILNPISYVSGPSKLCSLYVRPEFRKSGIGKLLSLSRFLFIAGHLGRFTGTLFADLRGVIDDSHTSPFWEGTGRHFFNLPLDEVHKLLEYGSSFILHFLPKYPIYISLLPKEVQEVVGKIDHLTEGAFNMLKQIGFSRTNEIDIFDGGPKVSARRDDIKVVKESQVLNVIDISSTRMTDKQFLISNERLDFRACFAFLAVTSKGIIINKETAKSLRVGLGDTVRVYSL